MKKILLLTSSIIILACSSEEDTSTEDVLINIPNSTTETSDDSQSGTSDTVSVTSSTTSSTESTTTVDTFNVTVIDSNGGSVNDVSGNYEEGSEIELIATPDDGYFFAGWTGIESEQESVTLTVTSSLNIQANFFSFPTVEVMDNIDVNYNPDFKIFTKGQQEDLNLSFSTQGGFKSIEVSSSHGIISVNESPEQGAIDGEITLDFTPQQINNVSPNITIAGEDNIAVRLIDLYDNEIAIDFTVKTQPEPLFKDYLKSSHDNQVSRLNLLDFYEIRHREGKADRFYCEYVEQTPGLYQDAMVSVGIIDINGDGYEDFVIPPTFNGDNDGIGEWSSREIEYEAYVYNNGEYKFTEEVWRGYIPVSYSARKALVADFDGDGDGDIYFACTGMDLDPYPRERETSWLLINEGDGTLGLKEINEFMSSHDSTAADFDGDGDIDIFSIGYIPNRSDGYHVGVLENIGGNNFIRKETFSGNTHNSYGEFYFSNVTTSEAADINNDGYMDVVWGGNEFVGLVYGQFMGYPRIELGNQTGKFNTDQSIFIPTVEGYALILDIDFYDIDGDGTLEIIINRAGDDLDENGQINSGFGFNESIGESYHYGGYYIQVVKLINNQAVDVTNQYIEDNFYRAFSDGCDPQSDWIRWLVIQDYDNDGNIDIFNPLIYFWGEGHESLRRWEWNGSRFTRINP